MKQRIEPFVLASLLPLGVLALYAGERLDLARAQPWFDGMFALALLFPAMMWGTKLAHLPARPPNAAFWVPLMGALVPLSGFVLAVIGWMLCGLPLLLLYPLVHIVRVVRQGQGKRRFGIAAAMLIFTLFACASYVASSGLLVRPRSNWEGRIVNDLRRIAEAEALYTLQHKRTATLDELEAKGLVQLTPTAAYNLVVRIGLPEMQKPDQFYAVAVPAHYPAQSTSPEWASLIPGSSLVTYLRTSGQRAPWAMHSFMVEEDGLVRYADLRGRTEVDRAEAERWEQR